jgi:adenosylmethionine-8-amino-7-oxononanoate aminotransferase
VFIARRQSYHGNTLGALAAGGNAWRRAQFAPLLIETVQVVAVLRIPRPASGESAEAIRPRLPRELEAEIRAHSARPA